ncbi:MAG: hypothetical protein AAGC95_11680 [Pseudomonadota bacterium]
MEAQSPYEILTADSVVTERRLSHRLFLHWLMQAGEAPYASYEDISPDQLGEDWDWCFILDVEKSSDFPYFTHLGKQLAGYSGVLLTGCSDWSCTVLDKATEKVEEMLRDRAPLLVQDELTLFNKNRLLFRSILLPLSDDQRTITHVLGAANGKLADA